MATLVILSYPIVLGSYSARPFVRYQHYFLDGLIHQMTFVVPYDRSIIYIKNMAKYRYPPSTYLDHMELMITNAFRITPSKIVYANQQAIIHDIETCQQLFIVRSVRMKNTHKCPCHKRTSTSRSSCFKNKDRFSGPSRSRSPRVIQF